MTENVAVSCGNCGRQRAGVPAVEALTWVAERENGTTRWMCPSCARRHVRDIEGKLPVEYW